MKLYKDVRSNIYPKKTQTKTKVYIPHNIKKETIEGEVIYIYDEIEYSLEEYIYEQGEKLIEIENAQKQQDQLVLESLFKIEMLEPNKLV